MAPTIAVTAPADGSAVARKSTVTIAATANDNVGVTYVEFYVNGTLKCTCAWKIPAGARNKIYHIDAKAYDTAGNIGNATTVTVTAR